MKEGNIMAYSDYLASRVRRILQQRQVEFTESASFGQLSFLLHSKFLLAVKGDKLEIRLDRDILEIVLEGREPTPLDPQGRRLKGFALIDPAKFEVGNELEMWIDLALEHHKNRVLHNDCHCCR